MVDSDSGESGIVFRELDTDKKEPAGEVAEIVADLKGVEIDKLAPAYEVIDDLLTHLFENPPSPEAQAKVEFHYEGYQITVHQDGSATFLRIT